MKKDILLFLLLVALSNYSNSQELKRRATLGVYGTEISDSVAKLYQVNSGIHIDSLINTEYSKKHHLRVNDIILMMDSVEIKSMKQLATKVSYYNAGDKLMFEIIRKGKRKQISGIFPAFPEETSDNHDVIYDDLKFDDGYIRTIIDKPKGNEKFPAILFIQGYTCSSIDNIKDHPYIQLAKGLCDKGYVVMRMEKPGIGDCNNKTSCPDLDFNTEKDAFLKSLRKLKTYDFVDTSLVFIWGHSLGGVIAPIIASEEKVKGIVVYGTTIKPWREYLIETFRYQYPLFGVDYVETEETIWNIYQIVHKLFIEKQTPAQIARDSLLSEYLVNNFSFDGKDQILKRNYKAYVQIDDYNMAQQWRDAATNTLVFWADADLEAFSRFDHETIADVVNHYHPGKGTFIHLENTTHSFAKVKSMQDGIENRNWKYITTHFNEDVVNQTDQWIESILNR